MKIAILSRHTVTRIGIKQILYTDFQDIIIFDSTDLESFIRKFPDQKPDIIITDIGQFGQYNVSAHIQLLSRYFANAKTIAYDEGIDFLRMQRFLLAGADGYVLKENSATELVLGIRQVMAGKRYVCDKGFRIIVNNLNPASAPKPAMGFTATKHKVAQCMGDGMDVSGIAKRLRSNAMIVKRIQSNVLQKMEIKN